MRENEFWDHFSGIPPDDGQDAITREICERSLLGFVEHLWPFVEPAQPFMSGWAIEAICDHLEAVTTGDIKRLIINVPPGFMKDCHVDEPVLTVRGRIRLGDVVVGDKILTHRGRYREVLAVHDNGVKETLKITTDCGRVLRPEINHPFLTPRGWVKASDLVIGDVLAAVVPGEDPQSDSMTEEEARVLGYLVGDGSVSSSPQFHNTEPEMLDDFEKCSQSLGFITSRASPAPSLLKKNAKFFRVNLKGALPWSKRHGLKGKNSYTKRIPPAVLSSSKTVIANFLGAYWSCDGTFAIRHAKARGSVFFASCTTVGEGLAHDIQHALLRLGVHARIRTKIHKNVKSKKQPDGYRSFDVMTTSHEETYKLKEALQGLCSRKQAIAASLQPQKFIQGPLREDKVVSIEPHANGECRCLTVEEDHSFTTHDIAVKNSMAVNVFYPAWEWGPMNMPTMRYISASYSVSLTERDNLRFRNVITSDLYRRLWGDRFGPSKEKFAIEQVMNDKTGWKMATSVSGVGTGARGDRILCLPGNSLILSDNGWVRIDAVVDGQISCKIAGVTNDGSIVWQSIETYEKNPRRRIVEIAFDGGSLQCTDDHPIFIQGRGFVAAADVKEGDAVVWAGGKHALSKNARANDGTGALEERTVRSVKDVGCIETVYNIRTDICHNYFANGILVHNCDDPNSVKEAESQVIRDSTNQWMHEVVPTRLNNPDSSAIILIQQRTHEEDVTGSILARELDYDHLMIPMEYDPARHCGTVIGWNDPRGTVDGDPYSEVLPDDERYQNEGLLAFPERFPPRVVKDLKETLGPYGSAGQLQQQPEPRGGGIFKLDWWKTWPPEDAPDPLPGQGVQFPPFEYVIASVDTAYTEKEENDPSAMVVLGVWRNSGKTRIAPRLSMDDDNSQQMLRIENDQQAKIMLIYAWEKHLAFRGPPEDKPPGVSDKEWNSALWKAQRSKNWGLVEWIMDTCKTYKVDHLIIEAKASGITVGQEIQMQLRDEMYAIELNNPTGQGDKVARAHSVVHLYSNGRVYAPMNFNHTTQQWGYPVWCNMVLERMKVFPKGSRKDIVDAMTQGLRHLRDTGMALRSEEAERDEEEQYVYKKKSGALYDV